MKQGASVLAEVTKKGPFAKIGELVKSKGEYNAKTKMLEEMELTSVASEDVEQGTQEE
jgi:hypothetical protein